MNDEPQAQVPETADHPLSADGNFSTAIIRMPKNKTGEWFPMYLCVFNAKKVKVLAKNVLCLLINKHKLGHGDNATVATVMQALDISRSSAYSSVSELVKLGLLSRERAVEGRGKVLVPDGEAADLLSMAYSEMHKGKKSWVRDEALADLAMRRAAYRNKLRRDARRRKEAAYLGKGPASVPCSEEEAKVAIERWGMTSMEQAKLDPDSGKITVERPGDKGARGKSQRAGKPPRSARQRKRDLANRPAYVPDAIVEERRKALEQLHCMALRKAPGGKVTPPGRENEEWRVFNERCDACGVEIVLGAFETYRKRYLQKNGKNLDYARYVVNWLVDDECFKADAERFSSGNGATRVSCDFSPTNHDRRIAAMREHAQLTNDAALAAKVDAYERAWSKIVFDTKRAFSSAPARHTKWFTSHLRKQYESAKMFGERDRADLFASVAGCENEWRELCVRTVPSLRAELEPERALDVAELDFAKVPAATR